MDHPYHDQGEASEQSAAAQPPTHVFLPYLLAASFPLAILLWNAGNMPRLAVIVETISLLLISVALLDGLLRLFRRRSAYGQLLFCAAIAFVMAYGHAGNLLWNLGLRRAFFLPIWCALFVVLIALLTKNSRSARLPRVALLLQHVLATLICLQTAWLGVIALRNLPSGNIAALPPVVASEPVPALPLSKLPDIYYIILDGYGREDVLRQSFQFDNRSFLESLKKRGFYIADRSRPNYASTGLSLASSLNMRYLNDLGLEAYGSQWPLSTLIRQSEVARCLKERGYKTVATQTGCLLTECAAFDRYIATCPHMFNEFQYAIYRTTVAYHILYLTSRWTGSLHTAHRDMLLGSLAALPASTRGFESPCFMFAHILLPHPPFVFDSQGNPVELSLRNLYNSTQSRRQYAEQLAFGNAQVLRVVDAIQSMARRPSLIVIQGDHGPLPDWFGGKESKADQLKERFAILNAICVPPGVDLGLYDTISPVNTFRLILDYYFHTKLGRLDDRCYISEQSHPYVFQEVNLRAQEAIADRRL